MILKRTVPIAVAALSFTKKTEVIKPMGHIPDTNISDAYENYVRPELGRMLSLLKLDLNYHYAHGDELRYKDHAGTSRAVTDFLGGYGSTILGHNYPAVLEELSTLINQKVPVHAQASLRSRSAQLGKYLNQMIHQETGDTRTFVMTTANSGAEAVEVAIKHALLQWKNKKETLLLNIEKKLLKLEGEELRQYYLKKHSEIKAALPMLLSLNRSFHGKTSSALFATANSDYRKMFDRGPFAVRFLDTFEDKKKLELTFADTDIGLEKEKNENYDFSPYFALIYEPIQGEGGINLLPKEFFQVMLPLLKLRQIPLIADEIQSGLFRTGQFLASGLLDVHPDYILLGKSLGGGVVKAACALIARDHYQDEFGWLHTSTNAEDDWTCAVALKTLEILFENKAQIRGRAQKFESYMYQLGLELMARFPGVIKAVKGKGFFIGLEFNFDLDRPIPSILRGFQHSGQVSYLFTSYLLHSHGLRVGVTLSSPETLRFEPSAFISSAALEHLRIGLTDLCEVLYKRDIGHLLAHLWIEKPQEGMMAQRPSRAEPIPQTLSASKATRVGFLSHVINLETLRSMDEALAGVSEADFRRLFKLNINQTAPFCYHQQEVRGLSGEPIILNVYGLFIPSYQFEEDLRKQTNFTLKKVQETVELATAEGCSYFGLGQYTSIVSGNGLLLKSRIPLTTGNSLTAGMSVRALSELLAKKSATPRDLRIGVVGFTGNICHVVAQLLGDLGYSMTLVHREPYAHSSRFQDAVTILLKHSKIEKESLICTHEIEALRDCDAVIVGTNSSQEFIGVEHLKPGAVVLDISVPSNLHPDVHKSKEFTAFQGGFVRFPYAQVPQHHWIPTVGSMNWFACMGETLLCGLHRKTMSYSIGNLSKAGVLDSLAMADAMGVTLGDLRGGSRF